MRLNVAVLFGGKACEHEISCISANQVIHALDTDRYNVLPVYIAKDQDMYVGPELTDLKNYADLGALCAKLTKVSFVKDGNKTYLRPVKQGLFKTETYPVDVAFLVMHGTNGEDGALQGMMEMLDLPYTSSAVLGSALGQDKVVQKQVLTYEGLPLNKWTYFTKLEYRDGYEAIVKKAEDLGYPIILKPANLGSSIGITIVHGPEELQAKVKEALTYDDKVLMETYLTDFKEINCAVISDGDTFRASVLEEVLKNDEILSFDDKYTGGSKGPKTATKGTKGGMANTSRIVPAPLDDEMTAHIQDLAVRAYKALNAYGCCRVDFIYTEAGDLYITELNSIPGSLAFYLWQEEGMDFTAECDLLIDNAIKRYRDRERLVRSFDTNILSTFKGGD